MSGCDEMMLLADEKKSSKFFKLEIVLCLQEKSPHFVDIWKVILLYT